MKRVRRRKPARKRVKIGAPDPSLTATSGVAAVAEFLDKLGVVDMFDRGVGSIKERARGVTAGELLVGLAQSQLLGGDALVALDRQRQDVAAAELSAVPGLASTTAGALARRFGAEQVTGIETATADLVARAVELLPVHRRARLSGRVTIDLDSTDVEVYGSRKQGMAYNYAGQRAGRPHLATWAEAGVTTAADLLAGNDDVRPRAAAMLRRGLAGVPEQVRAAAAKADRLRVRADAGYFTADLAQTSVEEGCDFAIAAKRNTAMWRAYASIGEAEWVDAKGMPGAQVAAVDYAPAGWPEDTYTIVRRVRVETEAISADPRSRRRRTIDPGQLALALAGTATHAYAVSFISHLHPRQRHRGQRRERPGRRGLVPAPHRHRGPDPRGQARRRPAPPPLGLRQSEHGVDVGSAARGEPLRTPPSPDRDRRERPRPRRPTPTRTALRASAHRASRPHTVPAAATRGAPVAQRARPDPSTRHCGLRAASHPRSPRSLGEREPGATGRSSRPHRALVTPPPRQHPTAAQNSALTPTTTATCGSGSEVSR